MRVLILGGGGREHAIAWKLTQSPRLSYLISCPGNPGLAELGDTAPDVDPNDAVAVIKLCKDRGIDLVIVGPEAPLAAGVANDLIEAGTSVFGPVREAARLEWSKSFAKEIMEAAGVPTAASMTFTEREAAIEYLEDRQGPYVVKADGLAAGKGVVVTESRGAATAWVDDCLNGKFGEAGSSVVIEDHLAGQEISIFYICAGGKAIALEPARDYKRLLDGGFGPNTGGMGCFSPVEDIDPDLVAWTTETVTLPTLAELASRGIEYTGFLYVGLMLTPDGAKVLEFNCRLGDPETEALMPRIESDLLTVLASATRNGLEGQTIEWSDKAAVDIVLAAPGYPESPIKGSPITGLDDVAGVVVFHAGTALSEEGLVTAGGRVLNVVGLGSTVERARDRAYRAARKIKFDGKQIRSDIGAQ